MPVYKVNEKTKDGRSWVFKCSYKDINGNTKVRHSGKFLTEDEAIEAEKEFLFNVENGTKEYLPRMTFKSLFNKFVENRTGKVSYNTYRHYTNAFDSFKMFHKMKCVDYTSEDFETWKKDLNNRKKLAIRTKNDLVKFWKSLLNFGMAEYGFKFDNAYKNISYFVDPGALKERMRYYTYKEFLQFLSAEKSLRNRCVWQIFYYCGLKTSELRALTWKDIDLRNKTLSVNNLYICGSTKEDYSFRLVKPTNRATARTIPMHKLLTRDLRRYYSSIYKNEGFKRTDFVFTNGSGDAPISGNELYALNESNAYEAGIKQLKFKEFRHSCAYLLITNGASIVTVAGFLGLSEIIDVYDNYGQFLPVGMTDVINIIDDLNNAKKL